MAILLTGGTGYIGSHTAVELIEAGYDVILVDNLVNSNIVTVDSIRRITKTEKEPERLIFYREDCTDPERMREIFAENRVDAVIHFAGLKAVGESVEKPLEYYRNNVGSTLTLLEIMDEYSVGRIVFSSSATVYGESNHSPLSEEMPVGDCTNPYGRTKYFNEEIIRDWADAGNGKVPRQAVLLRYFNPVGAHKSGLIGEDPLGIPNNLMPYIQQVASGRIKELSVFGDDYETKDGTGVRDYIHISDLARGHVAALKMLMRENNDDGKTQSPETAHSGGDKVRVYNLGTGAGCSVLEMIEAFEKANGVRVPYVISPRRAGDIACCFADPGKAELELGWKAELGPEEMCRDAWNWEKNREKQREAETEKEKANEVSD